MCSNNYRVYLQQNDTDQGSIQFHSLTSHSAIAVTFSITRIKILSEEELIKVSELTVMQFVLGRILNFVKKQVVVSFCLANAVAFFATGFKIVVVKLFSRNVAFHEMQGNVLSALLKTIIFSFMKGELTKLLKKTENETSVFKLSIFVYIIS